MTKSVYTLKDTLKEMGLSFNRTWVIKVGSHTIWNGKLGGRNMLLQIDNTIVSGRPIAERENHDELVLPIIEELKQNGYVNA